MSTDGNRTKGDPAPDELRSALHALGQEVPPDEHAFEAGLHRRLAAAGAPPATSWLARVRDGLARGRPMLTGALVGALVTATAFLLLGARAGGERTEAAREEAELTPSASPPLEPPSLRPGQPGERKLPRASGDRPAIRDRLGADIGAERPERPRGRGSRF